MRLILLCCLACALLPAQTPKADFSVDLKLVNVVFSVRNRSASLVTDLTRDDVELYEDGVPQQLRNFATDRETPLTLGLLIDLSGSQREFTKQNAVVAQAFLRRILRPQDRVFLVGFVGQLRVLAPPEAAGVVREQALRNPSEAWNAAPLLGPGVRRKGASPVLDAVYWSTRQFLLTGEGRKALLMIGDGMDTGSRIDAKEVRQVLQNSGVVFYGLNNGGGPPPSRKSPPPNRMPELCAASRGREFETWHTPPAEAFAAIEMELRALYSAGYVSTNPARDGSFRRIEVKLKRPGLQVRARPGYYAQ